MQQNYGHLILIYLRLFWRGACLGWRSFWRNGRKAAGLKRSIGFFLQPIENWSRYPEIALAIHLLGSCERKRILDLGSPKMVGMLLAEKEEGEFILTDIWPVATEEFADLHRNNAPFLKGKIDLTVADLTSLKDVPDESIDSVYSLSVIEHIESLDAIKQGLREIARVLKPGGVCVLSFCARGNYTPVYVQHGIYGKENVGAQVFFAHYFDPAKVQEIFFRAPGLNVDEAYYSEWLTQKIWLKLWMHIPSKIRGFLGIVNVLIAPCATQVTKLSLSSPNFTGEGDVIVQYFKGVR